MRRGALVPDHRFARPCHWIWLLCVLVIIAGPAQGAGDSAGESDADSGGKRDPEVVMEFFDSSVFDQDLSDHFRADHQAIEVRPLSPFSLNDIPERLDKWFSVIKDSGGHVGAREIPPEGEPVPRGILSMVIDVLTAVFDWWQEEQLYGPAEDYDALLLYRKDTGMVEKILFLNRD